jgi:thymidine phosphorylase
VRGDGPDDLTELVLDSCAHLLALSDLGVDFAEARRLAEQAVADGSASAAYGRWIRAQGGDPDEDALPRAPFVREVFAPRNGYVHGLAARAIGVAALHLGAGRLEKNDTIDHSVGVTCLKKHGDAVDEGEPLAEIHARDEASAAEAAADVLRAYELDGNPPPARPILLDTIG